MSPRRRNLLPLLIIMTESGQYAAPKGDGFCSYYVVSQRQTQRVEVALSSISVGYCPQPVHVGMAIRRRKNTDLHRAAKVGIDYRHAASLALEATSRAAAFL